MVTLCMLVCFALSRFTHDGLIVGSLAASSFIAVGFPMAESSRARYLIGGYACAIVSGIAVHYAGYVLGLNGAEGVTHILLPMPAIFLTCLGMLLFDLQHPPSAALAVSIVLDQTPFRMATLAFVSIAIIALLRTACYYGLRKLSVTEDDFS